MSHYYAQAQGDISEEPLRKLSFLAKAEAAYQEAQDKVGLRKTQLRRKEFYPLITEAKTRLLADPWSSATAWYELGLLSKELKLPSVAYEAFEQANNIDPANAAIAAALHSEGQTAEEEEEVNRDSEQQQQREKQQQQQQQQHLQQHLRHPAPLHGGHGRSGSRGGRDRGHVPRGGAGGARGPRERCGAGGGSREGNCWKIGGSEGGGSDPGACWPGCCPALRKKLLSLWSSAPRPKDDGPTPLEIPASS